MRLLLLIAGAFAASVGIASQHWLKAIRQVLFIKGNVSE